MGAFLASLFNMEWECYVWAGGVAVSEFCLLLVVFPAKCISSISPRFYFRKHAFKKCKKKRKKCKINHSDFKMKKKKKRKHAFCFLSLVAILESWLHNVHIIFGQVNHFERKRIKETELVM
jgi:hypothetical protein